MKLPTAKYEVYMQRIFYKLGMSIGYHPWKYIFGLIVCTAICSIGFLRFHQINNARVTFTDSDAMSRYEGRVLESFLEQNGTLLMIECCLNIFLPFPVMINANDNASLLRPDFREQLWDMSYEISNTLGVKDHHDNFITYRNMCEPYCQKNDAYFAVMKIKNENMTAIDITYPVMEVVGRRVFLGNSIYGVTVNNQTAILEDFRTIILHYFLVYDDIKMMHAWEKELVYLAYESDKYPLLRASVASDNLVSQEVKAMGTKSAPYLSISLALLMVFLMLCSFRYDRRESKPIEAMLGGVTPILASITCIGMVSATGLAFQSIVVSTLFVMLAIGIDDVFIMLAAWHRTDKDKDIPVRMAEMVKEAGCSMTVTSVTNFISFGNGVLSSTPVLQTFAIYSTVASVVCYAYQLILFPCILALTAHREYKDIPEDCRCCIPAKIEPIRQAGKFHDKFFRWLAKVVGTWWMAALTTLVLIVYWTISVYGVTIVKTELAIQHLAPPESRISIFKTEYELVIKEMQTIAIVVQYPGDLRNTSNLGRVKSVIKEFETASYSYGHQSTFCWLPQYEDFLSFYGENDDEDSPVNFTYVELPMFVKSEENSFFRGTLKLNETACMANRPECLRSFLFTTAYTTLSYYNEMIPLIEEWRAISTRYPELGVISYTERHNFADQTASLKDNIWQTLASEVICMGLSFIVFIPDTVSIIAAMFSLISVNLGVFGFLSLWGVGIDPFSMASLLMSIGFSVDICAHISYHYYEEKGETPREKLEATFLNIGWPTIQGGMSTMLAMCASLLKPSHLGSVFFKTVFLVTVFGLIHGLIVLPVYLSLLSRFFKRGDRVSDNTSQTSSMEGIQPHRITIKSLATRKAESNY